MKRLVVDPITRIEGHLRIEAELEGSTIKSAYSSGTMVRGIEIIVPHPIEKYSTGRGFAGKGTISSLVNRRRTFLAPTMSASSSYPHRRHLKCSPLRFNLS